MKKYILPLLLATGLYLPTMAQTKQKFSEEEFRAKKEAFFTKKADLTPEESAQFFPLYFELQDRKAEINRKAWKKGQEGKAPETTEAEYNEIIDVFIEAEMQHNLLHKEYLNKLKKFLSNQKIYKVVRAEIIFNRNMLRIMQESEKK